MKTRALFFALVLVMMPALSDGQVGGLLKKGASKVLNSVGKATAKEANKEIDSAAQKQADKMVENAAQDINESNQSDQSDQQGRRSSGQGVNLGGLFGGKVDLKYNEDYAFNSRMVMKMEMYDDKDVMKMDYNIYYSASSADAGIEMKTVVNEGSESVPMTTQIIVDGGNKCMIMLSDLGAMKIGMISEIPEEGDLQTQEASSKPPVVTKTGNSKVIAGYKCDEYTFKEPDEKDWTKLWMTKDAVLNIDKHAWSKAGMPTAYAFPGFEGMTAMGWEAYDEKDKLLSKSEVVEINQNYNHSMSPKGYSLRQINFNQMQGGQGKK
jgi:hypothetical protein